MSETELLREAQLMMVKALKELDRICSMHDISYWIDAGTLLGAVRHGGFIPWDDDIDVCMTRTSYEKFLVIASDYKSEEYFIHIGANDPFYANINIPCKFRIKNTTVIEKSEIKYGYYDPRSPHGLFIDIFPYDKYSKNKIIRKYLERFLSYFYMCKVFTKYQNLESIKKIARCVGFAFPVRLIDYLKKKQLDYMSKRKHFVYGAGIETPFKRAYFSEEEIFPLGSIDFEGITVRCPNNHLRYLEKMFGSNYMSLPDEEGRVSHYYNIVLRDKENDNA